MRIGARKASAFCRAPDRTLCGVLLYGQDEGLVAMRRRELCHAFLGPEADPLQISRFDGPTVRRDPGELDAAIRARGFFAGRPLVLVEGAGEALAQALASTLEDITSEEAFVVVTAGNLQSRSALRRLFEEARHLAAVPVTGGTPSADEIEERLNQFGLRCGLAEAARPRLLGLAAAMDGASFDRFLEALAIFALESDAPLDDEQVARLAPSASDTEMDAFVDTVAEGRADCVGPMLRRVATAGANGVSILLALQRHFRLLWTLQNAGGRGWGPRKDAATAQVRNWRRDQLELAVRLLYDTDARLRSPERLPELAVVERCALRLAMMATR